MDYFKAVKRERVRFFTLVDALLDSGTSVEFRRDVMLFLNTLINR